MPITDEALLQLIFARNSGQPLEFIMAEFGKAKRLYQEQERQIAQGNDPQTIEVEAVQTIAELPSADNNKEAPKKRFTKRSLKVDPKTAITDESITCCLCGKQYKVLNKRHLAAHGIDSPDYMKLCDYPVDTLLMAKKVAKQAEQRGKALAKANAKKRMAAKDTAK